MALRLIRIAGIAAGLAFLFDLSRRAGIVRGNDEVPGMPWALGVLAFVFLLRAIGTELTQDARSNTYKDLLWGLTLGTLVAVLMRL